MGKYFRWFVRGALIIEWVVVVWDERFIFISSMVEYLEVAWVRTYFFKVNLYLWRILRAVLSHLFNSLVLHFKYYNFAQVKIIFLCFGRISASILYFVTKVRRVLFAGDGRVVSFGRTWIESQYLIHALWWIFHSNWIMRRYHTEIFNRRPSLLVL